MAKDGDKLKNGLLIGEDTLLLSSEHIGILENTLKKMKEDKVSEEKIDGFTKYYYEKYGVKKKPSQKILKGEATKERKDITGYPLPKSESELASFTTTPEIGEGLFPQDIDETEKLEEEEEPPKTIKELPDILGDLGPENYIATTSEATTFPTSRGVIQNIYTIPKGGFKSVSPIDARAQKLFETSFEEDELVSYEKVNSFYEEMKRTGRLYTLDGYFKSRGIHPSFLLAKPGYEGELLKDERTLAEIIEEQDERYIVDRENPLIQAYNLDRRLTADEVRSLDKLLGIKIDNLRQWCQYNTDKETEYINDKASLSDYIAKIPNPISPTSLARQFLGDKIPAIKMLADVRERDKLMAAAVDYYGERYPWIKALDNYGGRLLGGLTKSANAATGRFFKTLNDGILVAWNEVLMPTMPYPQAQLNNTIFKDFSDYIFNEKVEGLPDVPEDLFAESLSSVVGLNDLFLTMAVTPQFRLLYAANSLKSIKALKSSKLILGGAEKAITEGAITGMKTYSFHLPTTLAGMGFANTYGDLLRNNPQELNRIAESFKSGGIGFGHGLIFNALGYGSGQVAKWVQGAKYPKWVTTKFGEDIGKRAAVPANIVTGGLGFGSFNIAEQLVTEGEATFNRFVEGFMFGVMLSVHEVPHIVYSRALKNYITTPEGLSRVFDDMVVKIQDLRGNAEQFRQKADDIAKKRKMREFKQGEENVINDLEKIIGQIEKSTSKDDVPTIKSSIEVAIGNIENIKRKLSSSEKVLLKKYNEYLKNLNKKGEISKEKDFVYLNKLYNTIEKSLWEKELSVEDIAEMSAYNIMAEVLDNIADYKAVAKEVLLNPENFIQNIKKQNLPKAVEDFIIEKVNKTVNDNKKEIRQSRPIANEIERLQQSIENIKADESIPERVKTAAIADIENKIVEKEAEINKLFAHREVELEEGVSEEKKVMEEKSDAIIEKYKRRFDEDKIESFEAEPIKYLTEEVKIRREHLETINDRIQKGEIKKEEYKNIIENQKKEIKEIESDIKTLKEGGYDYATKTDEMRKESKETERKEIEKQEGEPMGGVRSKDRTEASPKEKEKKVGTLQEQYNELMAEGKRVFEEETAKGTISIGVMEQEKLKEEAQKIKKYVSEEAKRRSPELAAELEKLQKRLKRQENEFSKAIKEKKPGGGRIMLRIDNTKYEIAEIEKQLRKVESEIWREKEIKSKKEEKSEDIKPEVETEPSEKEIGWGIDESGFGITLGMKKKEGKKPEEVKGEEEERLRIRDAEKDRVETEPSEKEIGWGIDESGFGITLGMKKKEGKKPEEVKGKEEEKLEKKVKGEEEVPETLDNYITNEKKKINLSLEQAKNEGKGDIQALNEKKLEILNEDIVKYIETEIKNAERKGEEKKVEQLKRYLEEIKEEKIFEEKEPEAKEIEEVTNSLLSYLKDEFKKGDKVYSQDILSKIELEINQLQKNPEEYFKDKLKELNKKLQDFKFGGDKESITEVENMISDYKKYIEYYESKKLEEVKPEKTITEKPEESEISFSKAEKERKQGWREWEGKRYERPEPIKKVSFLMGNEVKVSFARKVKEKAKWAIVDNRMVQPSHRGGMINPLHFVWEAQPRERGALKILKTEAERKAEELADGKVDITVVLWAEDAFHGAPNINRRGEVIQGSGRAAGLEEYFRRYKNDPAGYNEALIKWAKMFGMNPKEVQKKIEQIKEDGGNAMLVRLHDVSDKKMIDLGNYVSSDVEDITPKGGLEKAMIQRMNEKQIEEISRMLLQYDDGQISLKDLIRKHGRPVLDKLMENDIIRKDALEQLVDSKTGQLNTDAVHQIENIFNNLLFRGGDPEIQTAFNNLPYDVRRGIEKAVLHLMRIPKEKGIINELQEAIMSYYQLKLFREENNNFKLRIEEFLDQTDMFGTSARERLNELEIELLKMFDRESTQRAITEPIKRIVELIKGKDPDITDMFDKGGIPGKSKKEAIEQVFKIEYNELTKPKKREKKDDNIKKGPTSGGPSASTESTERGISFGEKKREGETREEKRERLLSSIKDKPQAATDAQPPDKSGSRDDYMLPLVEGEMKEIRDSDLKNIISLKEGTKRLADNLGYKLGTSLRTGLIKRWHRKAGALHFPLSRIIRLGSIGEFRNFTHEIGHEMDNVLKFSDNLKFVDKKVYGPVLMAYGRKNITIRNRLLENLKKKYGEDIVSTIIHKKEIRDELNNMLGRTGYPTKNVSEAVAEFTANWCRDPEAAQKMAPKYYRLWTDMLETNPQFKGALKDIAEWYKQYDAQDPLWKQEAQIHREPKGMERMMNRIREIVTGDYTFNFLDASIEFRRLEAELLKINPKLEGKDSPLKQMLTIYGLEGKVKQFFENHPFLRAGNDVKIITQVDGFLKTIKPLIRSNKVRLYENYLLALRNLELYELGHGNSATSTPNDAFKIIERLEKQEGVEVMREFREKVYEYQQAVLDYYYQSGMISKDLYNLLQENHKFYIPMRRFFEEWESRGKPAIKGSSELWEMAQQSIRKLKGGKGREVLPPFEQIMLNTYEMIRNAERNHALMTLVKAHQSIDAYFEAAGKQKEKGATIQEIPANKIVGHRDLNTGKMSYGLKKIPPKGGSGHIVGVRDKGELKFFEIPTSYYDQYFTAQEYYQGWNDFYKMMSYPSRLLKAGAVVFNPTFMFRNITRDQLSAVFYSRYGYNPLDFLKGVNHIFTKSIVYQKFLASGADQAFLTNMDKMLERNYMEKQIGNRLSTRTKMYLTNPLLTLQDMTRLSELATRVGSFRKAYYKTGDVWLAMQEAREIAADYAMRGSVLRPILPFYPFFNANLQHTKMSGWTLGKRATHTMSTAFKYVIPPTLAIWAWNNYPETILNSVGLESDLTDEEAQKLYNQRHVLRKYGLYEIRIPGTKSFAPLPKGIWGTIFGTPIESLLDWSLNNDSDFKKEFPRQFLREISPVSTFGGTIPYPLRPLAQQYSNMDFWTGRKIVPESMLRYAEGALQSNDYTPQILINFGEKVGWSPLKIDKLIQNLAGGGASGLIRLTDEIAQLAGVVDKKPEDRITKLSHLPITKALVSPVPIGSRSAPVHHAWEAFDELEEIYSTYFGYINRYGYDEEKMEKMMMKYISKKDNEKKLRWYIGRPVLDKDGKPVLNPSTGEGLTNKNNIDYFKRVLAWSAQYRQEVFRNKTLTYKEKRVLVTENEMLITAMAYDFHKAYKNNTSFNLQEKAEEALLFDKASDWYINILKDYYKFDIKVNSYPDVLEELKKLKVINKKEDYLLPDLFNKQSE